MEKKWHEKYSGKPEGAHMGLLDDALYRIAEVASHGAALPENFSDRQLDEYESTNIEFEDDFMPHNAVKKTADFSRISSPQDRRLAMSLYGSSEEDSAEIENSYYLFYPNDLAILRIQAGRDGDIVKIRTFNNEDSAYECWADVTSSADR